jgi:hypothetical protein
MTIAETLAGAIVNTVNAGLAANGALTTTGFDQSNHIASFAAWSSSLPSIIAAGNTVTNLSFTGAQVGALFNGMRNE